MKKFIPIFVLWFLLSSCSEEFLDRPPNSAITGGNFPATEEDALLAINGAYSSLRIWQIYSGGFPVIDIVSDESSKGSNPGDAANLNLYDTFDHDPSDGAPQRWWSTLYEAIRRTNLVIEKVPEVQDMDPVLQQRIIAEARFLRGYFYSTLVRAFGDVVVVTTSTVDYDERKPRTAKEEVWQKLIFPDLQFAADNLPLKSEYATSNLGRATKGAAEALMARCYLFVGDFVNAEKYALNVIQSEEYSLEATFSDAFSVDIVFGDESVFEIGANGRDRSVEGGLQRGETQGVRGNPSRGWGFNRPTYSTIQGFGHDPRLDASVIFLGDTLDGIPIIGDDATPDTLYDSQGEITEIECYNQKVWTPYEAEKTSYDVNRRIIRYADVLLMAAEALNENDKSEQALPHLNAIRERARGDDDEVLPDITTTDQDELREAIYIERSRELAFEGLRFWDLVRTGRAPEVLGPLGFVEGVHEVFPIPLSEIDVSNGAIQQNNGY